MRLLFQRGFPIWFREFHIIKAFRLAKAAYNLLKPFLQERVKVRAAEGQEYRVAHLLREKDMLTPNLKLRLAVNLSCELGQ